MKESVTVSIGHHRVGTGRTDQLLEDISVELGCCDMDWALA